MACNPTLLALECHIRLCNFLFCSVDLENLLYSRKARVKPGILEKVSGFINLAQELVCFFGVPVKSTRLLIFLRDSVQRLSQFFECPDYEFTVAPFLSLPLPLLKSNGTQDGQGYAKKPSDECQPVTRRHSNKGRFVGQNSANHAT